MKHRSDRKISELQEDGCFEIDDVRNQYNIDSEFADESALWSEEFAGGQNLNFFDKRLKPLSREVKLKSKITPIEKLLQFDWQKRTYLKSYKREKVRKKNDKAREKAKKTKEERKKSNASRNKSMNSSVLGGLGLSINSNMENVTQNPYDAVTAGENLEKDPLIITPSKRNNMTSKKRARIDENLKSPNNSASNSAKKKPQTPNSAFSVTSSLCPDSALSGFSSVLSESECSDYEDDIILRRRKQSKRLSDIEENFNEEDRIHDEINSENFDFGLYPKRDAKNRSSSSATVAATIDTRQLTNAERAFDFFKKRAQKRQTPCKCPMAGYPREWGWCYACQRRWGRYMQEVDKYDYNSSDDEDSYDVLMRKFRFTPPKFVGLRDRLQLDNPKFTELEKQEAKSQHAHWKAEGKKEQDAREREDTVILNEMQSFLRKYKGERFAEGVQKQGIFGGYKKVELSEGELEEVEERRKLEFKCEEAFVELYGKSISPASTVSFRVAEPKFETDIGDSPKRDAAGEKSTEAATAAEEASLKKPGGKDVDTNSRLDDTMNDASRGEPPEDPEVKLEADLLALTEKFSARREKIKKDILKCDAEKEQLLFDLACTEEQEKEKLLESALETDSKTATMSRSSSSCLLGNSSSSSSSSATNDNDASFIKKKNLLTHGMASPGSSRNASVTTRKTDQKAKNKKSPRIPKKEDFKVRRESRFKEKWELYNAVFKIANEILEEKLEENREIQKVLAESQKSTKPGQNLPAQQQRPTGSPSSVEKTDYAELLQETKVGREAATKRLQDGIIRLAELENNPILTQNSDVGGFGATKKGDDDSIDLNFDDDEDDFYGGYQAVGKKFLESQKDTADERSSKRMKLDNTAKSGTLNNLNVSKTLLQTINKNSSSSSSFSKNDSAKMLPERKIGESPGGFQRLESANKYVPTSSGQKSKKFGKNSKVASLLNSSGKSKSKPQGTRAASPASGNLLLDGLSKSQLLAEDDVASPLHRKSLDPLTKPAEPSMHNANGPGSTDEMKTDFVLGKLKSAEEVASVDGADEKDGNKENIEVNMQQQRAEQNKNDHKSNDKKIATGQAPSSSVVPATANASATLKATTAKTTTQNSLRNAGTGGSTNLKGKGKAAALKGRGKPGDDSDSDSGVGVRFGQRNAIAGGGMKGSLGATGGAKKGVTGLGAKPSLSTFSKGGRK